MTWTPLNLTREQLEERRLEGGRLLRAGQLSQAEIARHLNVSRASVSAWAKIIRTAGLRGLRRRKAAGSSSKLTPAQRQTPGVAPRDPRSASVVDSGGGIVCLTCSGIRRPSKGAQLSRSLSPIGKHPNAFNRL